MSIDFEQQYEWQGDGAPTTPLPHPGPAPRKSRTTLIVVISISTVLAVAAAAVAALFLLRGGHHQATPKPQDVAAATAARSGDTTVVSWDPYKGAVKYKLERFPTDNGTLVATTNGTSYTDKTAPTTPYYYELQALAADGHAISRTTTVSVDAVPDPTPTTAPVTPLPSLTAAEQSLVNSLPSDVVDKESCASDDRGNNQVAAVTCDVPAGQGGVNPASKVFAQRYRSTSSLRRAMDNIGDKWAGDPGVSCSNAVTVGRGTWSVSGVQQGDDFCFLDGGSAWMDWSYDAARIRIEVSSEGPSVSGLVNWWSVKGIDLE